MSTVVFLAVTQCNLVVSGHKRFGGMYYLHLQGKPYLAPQSRIIQLIFKLYKILQVLKKAISVEHIVGEM
jgi:hypothetical protein